MRVIDESSLSRRLMALGLGQATAYVALTVLSRRFVYGEGHADRPILEVSMLLGSAFCLYLASWLVITRSPEGLPPPRCSGSASGRSLLVVLGFGLLFRAILWSSQPIQEIDYYRYLWDGRVCALGYDPHEFSPADVERFREHADANPRLRRLATLSRESAALETIFARIHFREIPTIYPPVSQWVFASAAWCTPASAPLAVHVGVLKAILLSFDVATILLLMVLLARVGLPVVWVVAYAWCPLVLKEIANSAHGDSIAVCLVTGAVALSTKASQPIDATVPKDRDSSLRDAILASACWAAATLAKWYPLVLAPVLVSWWRHRLGRRCWVPLATYAVTLGVLSAPLLTRSSPTLDRSRESIRTAPPRLAPDDEYDLQGHDAFEGLREFFSRWEVNDLLFALVRENLGERLVESDRPNDRHSFPPGSRARSSTSPLSAILDVLGVPPENVDVPFLIAQIVVGTILLLILGRLALTPWPDRDPAALPRRVFFSLAWLWFLAPTQNPWYWTWAVPFLVFVRGPWLLVSGAAMLYYLRFWFIYHFPEPPVWGTAYSGQRFFDHLVVWVEHAPILVLIAIAHFRTRRRARFPGN